MVKKINLFVLFFFLASVYSSLFAMQPLKVQSKEETIANGFKLTDTNNNTVSLSDFKDRPVILFFWTTWCPFCRKELKALAGKYDNIQKDGLELLSINVGESLSRVEKFISNNQLPFRALLDEDSAVADAYDVLGVPTYVYINKLGVVQAKGNSFSQGEYQKLISQ